MHQGVPKTDINYLDSPIETINRNNVLQGFVLDNPLLFLDANLVLTEEVDGL